MLRSIEHEAVQSFRRLFCLAFCGCSSNEVIAEKTYSFNGFSFSATGAIMLTVKDSEVPGTVTVTVAFTDSKGRPASVDGVPVWAADNPTVVDRVTAAADGMSAVLHITDNLGASQVSVTADVDLGSGVNTQTFVDTVSVIAGDATAATFSFGAVTPDGGATGGTGSTGGSTGGPV